MSLAAALCWWSGELFQTGLDGPFDPAVRMPSTDSQPENQKMFTLALLVVSVAALYLAADVLMPLALAILLTFILAPLVSRLERVGLPRAPSVLVVVGAAFAVLFSIGWVVGNQMVNLASEAQTYQQNIVARIQQFKRSEDGPLSRLERSIKQFSAEIAQPAKQAVDEAVGAGASDSDAKAAADQSDAATPAKPEPPPASEPKPIPVEIVQPRFTPYEVLSGILPGAFGWLATAGIVIVFLIFMLLEHEDMRNRLIRLIGSEQINVTTQALDDAGRRVGKYLRMQLIINASYGLMLALGLYLIGLPNAITWGLFAGMLRYLPYVGPWMGASVGILLSLAVFPNWTEPLLTAALFVAAELIVNNLLEPVLYHSSTGISTVGILAAALFWTWLWGPIGLVLSTPLTVCIAVIGRYVPNLAFLDVLLTDAPVLPPGAHFYQRLLVSDEEESRELVEEYLREGSVDELFEDVLLPALVLTERDAHRGTLDESRREYILENVHDLLDELPELAPDKTAEMMAPLPAADKAVMIVPARDTADEIAAQMLHLRLAEKQIDSTVLSSSMLFGEVLEQITRSPSPLVIISAVPPFAVRHARRLTKRLRSRLEGVNIVVAVWHPEEHGKRTAARITAAGANRLVHRLAQATEAVQRHVPCPAKPAAGAPDDPAKSSTGDRP